MTGFHRRTNFSAPTALVNAGLIPIPLFSFAPGQKAFTAALPLIISFGIIISALQGKCKPPAQLISQSVLALRTYVSSALHFSSTCKIRINPHCLQTIAIPSIDRSRHDFVRKAHPAPRKIPERTPVPVSRWSD